MGTEESKKPNGEVRQVSHGKDVKVREMRTAKTLLTIIQDRGKRQLPLDDVYRKQAKVSETRKLESRVP